MSVDVAVPEAQVEPQSTEGTPPPVAASDAKVSQHLLDLARKEKALRHQYKELKSQKDALRLKETEYQTKYIDRDRLTKDPISILNELGLTQEQIAQMLLNQQQTKDPYLSKVDQKLKQLEDAQKQFEERQATQAKTQYDQAVNQIRNDIKILVDSDTRFESIKEMKAEEAVVELIKKTFDSEGVILSADEAAQQVEDYILEEATRMFSLNKIKAKYQEVAAKAKEEEIPFKNPAYERKPTSHFQIKTLTNAQTTTASKPNDEKSRRERAVLAFQGLLKE